MARCTAHSAAHSAAYPTGRPLLTLFGRPFPRRGVERRPVLAGAGVTLAAVLVVGVGLGSIVAERSGQATLVNAALFAGVIAGGFVAGYGSRRSPLLAGTLASFPAAVAAVVVQLVRWAGDAGPVPLLGVALAVLLTASLGTLGGVLGRFRSPVRRSLYR